eukprot:Hpha_TRINITY_DN28547_c0_g1::TRINITY_DN28547_c0_g1_i1::g.18548::m.18548
MIFALATLSVQDPDGSVEQFVLNADEPVGRAFALFCRVRGLPEDSWSLTCRGRPVRLSATVRQNGIIPTDVLRARPLEGKGRSTSPFSRDALMTDDLSTSQALRGLEGEVAPGVTIEEAARMERDKLMHLVRAKKVRTQLESSDLVYTAQADPAMVTEAAIGKRRHLQRTHAVIALIVRLWRLLPKAASGKVSEGIYRWFCRVLFFRLEPRDLGAFCGKEARFEDYFREDWLRDSGGKPELGFSEFYNAMAQFSDVWTDSLAEEDYCRVLLLAVEATELALLEQGQGAQIAAALDPAADFHNPPASPRSPHVPGGPPASPLSPRGPTGPLSPRGPASPRHQAGSPLFAAKHGPTLRIRRLEGRDSFHTELKASLQRRDRENKEAKAKYEQLLQGARELKASSAGARELERAGAKHAALREAFEAQLAARVNEAAKRAEMEAMEW